ncbi:hypothetical protein [Acinetobacter bereziniae]|jgi:predicted RNA-binding Zn-ribbon protein involved in translation (DUF1610 family)|uniref:hypothetical protein n=2 Tax=Acinetobacter TaxID=469 RepID=UPI000289F03F|nr:hypothetical protein [Acinetobacter bereziniae]MBJ9909503.1 hypothetical protein [Acinetobacter bereziniae]MBJ9931208.1 hypothetical protein [Acinetobacter bereziniae]
MRPNCPVCNSIQTKLTSNNSVLLPFSNYKCKNCGNDFVLRDQKKKGGCLWSIIKYTLSAIFLGLILLWLFQDDVPKRTKESAVNNVKTPTELTIKSNSEDHKIDKIQSIRDSKDMNDTLSIKTEIRESQ